jgi:hypothetical protein
MGGSLKAHFSVAVRLHYEADESAFIQQCMKDATGVMADRVSIVN